MADTVHTNLHQITRPVPVSREPVRDYYLSFDDEVPSASEISLDSIDFMDFEIWRQDKMWDRFERLRKEDPLHRTEESMVGAYWSATKYEDILAIDIDHKRFSSSWEYGGVVLGPGIKDFDLPSFITMDEPRHSEQRKTAQPAVAPNMLKNYEPVIRKRTQNLLDSLPVGEPFDWVDTVSIELTTMMLATLFDYPFEDRRQLTRWSDVTTGRNNRDICPGGKEQWEREMLECLETFQSIFEERKKKDLSPDFMSLLAHGDTTKDLTPTELLGTLTLLIVGGNDTTRNSMTGSVYGLNHFPEEYEKLKANPSLVPNMVAEVIRWQTPLAYMRRTALEDVEMRGKTIKKGDQVAMWYVSGNRDEDFWNEDPNRLIVDRKQARNHLSFGFGIHRCVGNRLAELQLRVLWEEILERFEHIELIDEPNRTPSSFIKGYTWMPVICHPL